MPETASCFLHGNFDAALRRCPECGAAGRGGNTTGAAARNSRPTDSAHELARIATAALEHLARGWTHLGGIPVSHVEAHERAVSELERRAASVGEKDRKLEMLRESNRALQRSAIGNRDGRKIAEAEVERLRAALEEVARETDREIRMDVQWLNERLRAALHGEPE